MKKSKKLLLILLCGSILTLMFMLSAAATPAPGSEEDPLVTRSYVDRLISDILNTPHGGGALNAVQMQAIIDEVVIRLGADGLAGDKFTPIHLLSGQTLFGNEGTEIILRSGSAVVQAYGVDGLADVTSGRDIGLGENIERNHLLIVPRTDGRGVHATSDIWLLVKGGFSVR